MLRHLDLFSGIGGFALAAQMVGGIETQQFVEIEPYAQKVLAKNFPGVPIHDDITTFTAERGRFDLITGGFPCQDISGANPNGRGLEGKRSGLFFELMRIVRECRPRYIVLENVSALLSRFDGRAMGAVLWELSQSGYDAEWQALRASDIGACHQRERIFIIAYSNQIGRFSGGVDRQGRPVQNQLHGDVATTLQKRIKRQFKSWQMVPANIWREVIPEVFRMDDGISSQLDSHRIGGLGNAVVPQVAAIALQRVLDINSSHANLHHHRSYSGVESG